MCALYPFPLFSKKSQCASTNGPDACSVDHLSVSAWYCTKWTSLRSRLCTVRMPQQDLPVSVGKPKCPCRHHATAWRYHRFAHVFIVLLMTCQMQLLLYCCYAMTVLLISVADHSSKLSCRFDDGFMVTYWLRMRLRWYSWWLCLE